MFECTLETELTIDWSDIDLLGHVNNLAIMRYMQTARVLFFEALGMSPDSKEQGIGPIMASVQGQFRKQLQYPGRVRVLSVIDEMRTTSMSMKHLVLSASGEVAAQGSDVIVIYDFVRQVKHPIPDSLRSAILAMPKKTIATS